MPDHLRNAIEHLHAARLELLADNNDQFTPMTELSDLIHKLDRRWHNTHGRTG